MNHSEYIFTENDFNDSNGMLPSVWGPPLWHFLHTMSFNYPVNPTYEQKRYYSQFIYSLVHVLPCRKCRENLQQNLENHPIYPHLKNRETFSLYIFKLHETINTLLNKKSGLNFNQVRNRYEHFRARCKYTRKSHIGCSRPLHIKKTKSVINIVPFKKKCKTLKIERKCFQ